MVIGYLGWAGVLLAQNYSFTYVSRARNSGSLARHAKAALFSNGIWIFSQILMLGPMFAYLTGKHGLTNQLIAAGVYTASTMTGSLAAHFVSKKTEKGKNAVGASEHYVQITKSEWENVRFAIETVKIAPTREEFNRVRSMAEGAYDTMVGLLPDSKIDAAQYLARLKSTGGSTAPITPTTTG